MISNKNLIDQLSKYPNDTEWQSLGRRCIACELGIIDMEPMTGNDLSTPFCNLPTPTQDSYVVTPSPPTIMKKIDEAMEIERYQSMTGRKL